MRVDEPNSIVFLNNCLKSESNLFQIEITKDEITKAYKPEIDEFATRKESDMGSSTKRTGAVRFIVAPLTAPAMSPKMRCNFRSYLPLKCMTKGAIEACPMSEMASQVNAKDLLPIDGATKIRVLKTEIGISAQYDFQVIIRSGISDVNGSSFKSNKFPNCSLILCHCGLKAIALLIRFGELLVESH